MGVLLTLCCHMAVVPPETLASRPIALPDPLRSGCLASGVMQMVAFGPEANAAQREVVIGMAAYEAHREGAAHFAFKDHAAPLLAGSLTLVPIGAVDPTMTMPEFAGALLVDVVFLRCVPMDGEGQPARVYHTEEVLHISPFKK